MIPIKSCLSEPLKRRTKLLLTTFLNRQLSPGIAIIQNDIEKKCKSDTSTNALFQPVNIKPENTNVNIGAEMTGNLCKSQISRVLSAFSLKDEVKTLAKDYGLEENLQSVALKHFREYCLETQSLPVDLHITFSDIIQSARNVTDLFPYFMRHAKQIFPHIDCLDDLKKIGDMRFPPNWYPMARSKTRKIIYHSGPTNSGKTYNALQRFMSAESGVYCGPLKLLAVEVFHKCNSQGTPCDLITGEEKKYAKSEDSPANHAACSVEMVNLNNSYEVAVIDEIQLMSDPSRGWAWTRALLGLSANEIHLCGEAAALDLIKTMCATVGEEVEVNTYKRLTKLSLEKRALGSLKNIRAGDCIVCFNKNDIFSLSRAVESEGKEVAVIYGSLPPGTKLAQADKFNDPKHPCKIMVATNAIGMGLNLHIRRIIFYSLLQITTDEKGQRTKGIISVSAALQIAGRAGRYKTQWETGYVTTLKSEDLPILERLLSQSPNKITQAGLHPTVEQIELFAYHLPNATLCNLIDIFVSLCTVDSSLYFMCNLNNFKHLAQLIEHIKMPLRARYVFCCAPINKASAFLCTMFIKFARQYGKQEKISFNWLSTLIGWPITPPKSLVDLMHLEAVCDVLDLYLWLSYRFMDYFPDTTLVRDAQVQLDKHIQEGIINVTLLLSAYKGGDIVNLQAPRSNEKRYKQKRNKENLPQRKTDDPVRKGKLTEKLLAEGYLTPEMVNELQLEWAKQQNKK